MKKQFFKKLETPEVELHNETKITEVELHNETKITEVEPLAEIDDVETDTPTETKQINIQNDITRIMNGPGTLFTWTGKYATSGTHNVKCRMEDTNWWQLESGGWVYCP